MATTHKVNKGEKLELLYRYLSAGEPVTITARRA